MKVKSLADLKKIKADVQEKMKLRELSDSPDKVVQVKVSMATCGIAAGAKEIMTFMIDELDHQGIEAIVTQTGCMGFCYAEPTIEVTSPGKKPVIFGHVDRVKALDIIENYIVKGEMIDGIIPVIYKTIDE